MRKKKSKNCATISIILVFWIFIWLVASIVPFILIIFLFEFLDSSLMDSTHKFGMTRPIYYFTQLNDSFIIQLIAVYAMYMLVENIKLIDECLIGLLLLKHKFFIRKLLHLSALVMFFGKLFSPFINKLSQSNLPLEMFNSSIHLKLKVSELNADVRDTFYVELNNYVLDNSLLNNVFPFMFFLFCGFFLFLIAHWLWEIAGIYKCDLELVRIEQYLMKYYSHTEEMALNTWLTCNECNEERDDEEKKNNFEALNWITWKPFYLMYEILFEKSKCELALEKIKLISELNELNEII